MPKYSPQVTGTYPSENTPHVAKNTGIKVCNIFFALQFGADSAAIHTDSSCLVASFLRTYPACLAHNKVCTFTLGNLPLIWLVWNSFNCLGPILHFLFPTFAPALTSDARRIRDCDVRRMPMPLRAMGLHLEACVLIFSPSLLPPARDGKTWNSHIF